jgi:hypothetical protein
VAVALSAYEPVLRDRLLERVFEYLRAERMPARAAGTPIEPWKLVGRYLGPQDTCVIVRLTEQQLVAEIVKVGIDSRSVVFDIDRNGQLVRGKDPATNLIRFFHSEHTGEAGLMLAMTAFRKEIDCGLPSEVI